MISVHKNAFKKLSDFQKEALKELGTMGAGQVANTIIEFLEYRLISILPLL